MCAPQNGTWGTDRVSFRVSKACSCLRTETGIPTITSQAQRGLAPAYLFPAPVLPPQAFNERRENFHDESGILPRRKKVPDDSIKAQGRVCLEFKNWPFPSLGRETLRIEVDKKVWQFEVTGH